MKFSLGTAQLSNNYGVLKKKTDPEKIFKFINSENIINFIDTAPGYINSEKLIGQYLKKKINITTKINPFQYCSVKKNLDQFKKDFENSLINLKTKTVYGLLFHNEKDINKKNHDKFFYFLEDLIKFKLIEKVGFSTYDTKNIVNNFEVFNFKIIQIPINIFNASKNYINYLSSLKNKYHFEIHARSVFLQGLGFLSKIKNDRFKKLNKKLDILEHVSNKFKISKFDIMLLGLSKLHIIDKCIIGFSSYNDMLALKNFKNKKVYFSFNNFLINDPLILDPRRWPKKI